MVADYLDNFLARFFCRFILGLVLFFTQTPERPMDVLSLIIFPFGAALSFTPYALVTHTIGAGLVSLGGFASFAGVIVQLVAMLIILPGDPFVFVLHKIKPILVPVENYRFLNFVLMTFVLDD